MKQGSDNSYLCGQQTERPLFEVVLATTVGPN